MKPTDRVQARALQAYASGDPVLIRFMYRTFRTAWTNPDGSRASARIMSQTPEAAQDALDANVADRKARVWFEWETFRW